MKLSCDQPGCPDLIAFFKAEHLLPQLQVKHPIRLSVETVLVATIALGAIRLLHTHGPAGLQWLAVPAVLALSALVPAWLGRRPFGPIGLDAKGVEVALGAVCRTFIYILPVIIIALWLMKRLAIPVPLQQVIGPQHDWVTWLLYQFLYVAVPEEMFFRGYVQVNVMRALNCGRWRTSRSDQGIAVLISAGCFALAHVVVQGQIIAAVTFLPGLVMAWLYIRTRTLLAPILFHGLANTTYAVLAMTLG